MDDDRLGLDAIVRSIRASRKYRHLSPDLIRRIASRELANRSAFKQAVDGTRGKLHQVAGAYWSVAPTCAAWRRDLARARGDGDPEALRAACRAIMRHHASTRERLPILETFYGTLLADLPQIHSVLDLACGLHPLAIPWMPLAEGASYHAIDIYEDLAAFLNEALAPWPIHARAEARDILSLDIEGSYDLAFLLKSMPCLEQVDRDGAAELLGSIPARTVILSFPAQTLGGKRKGMAESYRERYEARVDREAWRVESFSFPTEGVVRLTRREDAAGA